MLFYKRIDKRKTIAKAKDVLNEYAKFKRIVSDGLYDLDTTSPALDHHTFSGYINFDTELIRQIDQKDRNYEEVNKYIEDIQSCINRLDPEEIEIINLKYVNGLSNREVIERLNSTSTTLDEKHFESMLKDIYINFAIAYGVYVIKAK